MNQFLKESDIVNYSHPSIQLLASELANGSNTDEEIAQKCFLYVRDEIRHSGDDKDTVTTYRSSDVLEHKTGWCYAKSSFVAIHFITC